MREHQDIEVVIIGAGPAGLTAAYQLCKAGVKSILLEKELLVGGLARTVQYKGCRFDVGGHRFFTKIKDVEQIWQEVLGENFLRQKRLSRIYYRRKFFFYPLRAWNALLGLGFWNSSLIILSFLKAQLLPEKPETTFEQWVSNRFGKRLYRIFFKTYTEKVWGISCNQISADWAAQRIKNLSLWTALKDAFCKREAKNSGSVVTSLIDTFHYPRFGTGMMWETMASMVEAKGAALRLGAEVQKIRWQTGRILSIDVKLNDNIESIEGTHYISSMPVQTLLRRFSPPPPQEVLDAAGNLHYRDFLTVVLIAKKRDLFPDNWIYIHDPSVGVGRIQNFNNWSPEMVSDPNKTCLGLEYFCFEGDRLWTTPDQDLIELGKKELKILGLVQPSDIEDGTVLKIRQAYPVYDTGYRESLQVIRRFLDSIRNLQLTGRNGMHKYNNQDHSMLTAMLAVKNILGADHDLWKVNVDQEYQEKATVNS